MYEKLQSVCDEIIQDEAEAKKFVELNTPEEIYAYFKEKIPNLSEDEFEDFIVTMLDDYADMQEKEPELVSDALNQVAGGVGLRKLSRQLAAGAMAVASFLPASASASGTRTNQPNSQYETSVSANYDHQEYHNKKKEKGTFHKIKKWVKDHKLLATGISLAAIAGSCFAVKKLIIDKKDTSKTSEESTETNFKIRKSKKAKKNKTNNSPQNTTKQKAAADTTDSPQNTTEQKAAADTTDSPQNTTEQKAAADTTDDRPQHETADTTDTGSTQSKGKRKTVSKRTDTSTQSRTKQKTTSKKIVDNLIAKLKNISDSEEAAVTIAKDLMKAYPIVSVSAKYSKIFHELMDKLKDYGHWDDERDDFEFNEDVTRDDLKKIRKIYSSYKYAEDEDFEDFHQISDIDEDLDTSDDILKDLYSPLEIVDQIRLRKYIKDKFPNMESDIEEKYDCSITDFLQQKLSEESPEYKDVSGGYYYKVTDLLEKLKKI